MPRDDGTKKLLQELALKAQPAQKISLKGQRPFELPLSDSASLLQKCGDHWSLELRIAETGQIVRCPLSQAALSEAAIAIVKMQMFLAAVADPSKPSN